jgi:protein-tyrosine-phosphatase
MKILFVCTKNTCQSAIAEACAREWIEKHNLSTFKVSSAGTQAVPGQPADELARELCSPFLHEHRSKELTHELVHRSDIIYVMSEKHFSFVHQMFGPVIPTTYYLSFADSFPDTSECSREVYRLILENTIRQLEELFHL